jgi:predicted metal-dependent phosphoesterase TrpH
MNEYVDLHLHSTCSDGALSPTEVAQRALAADLKAIALADHDNIDGIAAIQRAGAERGLEVVPGVELSVVWRHWSDIHLLGYAFDHHHPALVAALREFQMYRETRNEQIVGRVNAKLQQEKQPQISFARVLELAGGTIGRPHIAMALHEAGVVKTTEEAFKRYLVPCNVAKRVFPVSEAIDLVHQAGGVTVLAHPPFVTRDRDEFRTLLDELVGLGLDGVEVYCSGTSRQDCDWYLTEARRRNLIVTGGSDFHGLPGETLEIGRGGGSRIPYSCVEEIRHRAERYALNRRQKDAQAGS